MRPSGRRGHVTGVLEGLNPTVRLLSGAADQVVPVLHAADTGVVAVLDVRHLSEINARHGAAAGDRVLAAMERSIRRYTRNQDCVARLPGDQFIVIQPGLDDEYTATTRLERASRVWVPVLRGVVVRATAGVGVAKWYDDRSRKAAICAAASRLHP